MSDVVKESIAPLVQRILADPLHFVQAKLPETHANRPQCYVKIGAAQSKDLAQVSAEAQKRAIEQDQEKKERAMARPKSLAQALAGYTGKRSLGDAPAGEKKRKRRNDPVVEEDVGAAFDEEEDDESQEVEASESSESHDSDSQTPEEVSRENTTSSDDFVSETPRNIVSSKVYEQFQSESDAPKATESEDNDAYDDADEDDEEDEDYDDAKQQAVDAEAQSESEAESESSETSTSESGSQEEDVQLLKKDLIDEKTTATPPTSPESEDEQQELPSKATKVEDFYQINAIANDRGSNKSQRIVKNWGPTLSQQKPLGLLNHGVTCYTNAAVQAMVHIPAVQHYLNDVFKNKYKDTINPRSVTHVLSETATRMWNPEKKKGAKYINPKKLIARLDDINCVMSEWQQEDSHEYFMSLLSRLQEDSTPKGHKLNESIIYDIFGGLLDQSVTCKSCGHVSKTQQEFYDLSLHLGSGRQNSISSSEVTTTADESSSSSSSHRYSIQKSIRDFFSPELIKTDRSDKSGYVCEKCEQRTNAIKISSIDRAPETLAVHLKRFRFNGSSSSKVKQGVSYPLIMDLTQYTTKGEPVLYQLISVVVHAGRSVSSGHYIAHCRQPDGSWATYDDEYINTISEKQALKDSSAYYLIYTRLTNKGVIANPSKFSVNAPSQHTSASATSSAKSPTKAVPQSPKPVPKNDKKLHSIGVIDPQSPNNKSQVSPKHKLMTKAKFAAMKPTNNLANITGKKQKRYASKSQGSSKRFKRY